jgi:hypothetical protein
VGEQRQTFYVHEAQLTSSSDFFKNALSREWIEKKTKTVQLPNHQPRDFGAYVDWLYTGRICSVHSVENDGPEHQFEWTTLRRYYKLASYLQDTDFKDAVIDALVDKMVCGNFNDVSFPGVIYPHTSTQSPHRRLAVDIALNTWPPILLSANTKMDHPSEFIADLMTQMGRRFREGVEQQGIRQFLEQIDKCKYHEHAMTDTPCYKTKHSS